METLYINARVQIPVSELHFRFTRSGGPGGQNVNRVSTRVEVTIDLLHSPFLDQRTKDTLRSTLGSKMDSAGSLRIVSQESRSQWKNRQTAIEKLTDLLRRALRPVKHRTASTATHASKEKRLLRKKETGEKKKRRRVDISSEMA